MGGQAAGPVEFQEHHCRENRNSVWADASECSKDLSEEFYEYLGWLFRFYNSFTVKYEGFQGLWEAVQYGLNPTAPKTLLWMNQTIQKDFPYRFDVFDPQYDDLAKELERDNYMELFTLQMLHSRQRIPLKQWLSRYQELTGADYGEYFRSWHTNGRRVFAFLVEKKEINLWEFSSSIGKMVKMRHN